MNKTMDIIIRGWDREKTKLYRNSLLPVEIKAASWMDPIQEGESRFISADALEPIGEHIEWCEGCAKIFLKGEICNDYCEECYSHRFCECGKRLEGSNGSPGDGLCRGCQ